MNNYISITEFANKIGMTTNETYKMLKNNFGTHLKTIDNTINISESFVNSFLSLGKETANETDFDIIQELKKEVEEKNKQIEELNNKIAEYTDRAFELAQSALNIQQQVNFITASKDFEKKGFFKRLFKKGISD